MGTEKVATSEIPPVKLRSMGKTTQVPVADFARTQGSGLAYWVDRSCSLETQRHFERSTGTDPMAQNSERSHRPFYRKRPMDYYRVKRLYVTVAKATIKIDLATVSKEICSQAIVGKNSDSGVSQRRFANYQSYNDCQLPQGLDPRYLAT